MWDTMPLLRAGSLCPPLPEILHHYWLSILHTRLWWVGHIYSAFYSLSHNSPSLFNDSQMSSMMTSWKQGRILFHVVTCVKMHCSNLLFPIMPSQLNINVHNCVSKHPQWTWRAFWDLNLNLKDIICIFSSNNLNILLFYCTRWMPSMSIAYLPVY